MKPQRKIYIKDNLEYLKFRTAGSNPIYTEFETKALIRLLEIANAVKEKCYDDAEIWLKKLEDNN